MGRVTIILLAIALLAAGCTATPDVTVSYYLPKGTLQTTVVRTLGCDVQDNVILASNVIAKVIYERDDATKNELKLRDLDGTFSNSDIGFTFYEDGRLSGLNATQTGQGGEIIKSAVALVGSVLAASSADAKIVHTECEFVRTVGKDKGLTLTFTDIESFASDTAISEKVIEAAPDSKVYFSRVQNLLGNVCLSGEKKTPNVLRATYDEAKWQGPLLKLKQPAIYQITVKQDGNTACSDRIWSGSIAVPQQGTPFTLPIPKAAVFGKQTFGVAIAESGAVTSLKYTKDSGIAAGLAATNEVVSGFTDTTAEEATALRVKADVIAQQQRLISCHTNQMGCK